MKYRRLLSIVLIALFNSTGMAETTVNTVTPDQLKIQVKGIVCSFCAYGTEKNLAKLNFLDKSQFGKDGVLVDIDTHQITLALQPDKPVRYADINEAIVKGGYDPVAYYAAIKGVIEKNAEGYQLVCQDNGQIYALSETANAASLVGKTVLVRTELSAVQVADSSDNQPILLTTATLVPQP